MTYFGYFAVLFVHLFKNAHTLTLLNVFGYTYTWISFSAIFTGGNNFCDFLFTFLEDKAFPTGGLLLKVRLCS